MKNLVNAYIGNFNIGQFEIIDKNIKDLDGILEETSFYAITDDLDFLEDRDNIFKINYFHTLYNLPITFEYVKNLEDEIKEVILKYEDLDFILKFSILKNFDNKTKSSLWTFLFDKFQEKYDEIIKIVKDEDIEKGLAMIAKKYAIHYYINWGLDEEDLLPSFMKYKSANGNLEERKIEFRYE